ncbi:hypothetical protein Taro_006833 [Colocasia esculenta]|uniref:Uncharacterized protein n=1 Tax=Colocasia esculenta TaxID=4460 RepID=A0A843TTH0_COLES|nr:hypothetical protein [Colocasia esculenta]
MAMRTEVSSLSLKPTPLPRLRPGPSRSPAAASNCGYRRQQHRQLLSSSRSSHACSSVRASDDRGRPPVRTLGSPEPPWLVLPPSPPENPFSSEAWSPEIQMKGAGGTGIPLSLRMVQMKKRMATASPRRWTESLPPAEGGQPGALEGSTGRAVSALVCMIGELQRSVLAGRDGGAVDESALDRASRDRRDSFVWLFRRVFFTSPNLVVSLLVLLANYVAFAAEKNSTTTGSAAATAGSDTRGSEKPAHRVAVVSELEGSMAESASESIRIGDYLNWFDIGVKEGNLDPRQHEDEETCVDRRRRVYERAIAEGGVNSLILSNYAQFLYRVANDHDRAEQYFQWAVMAEPRDAEAISRYASFLWAERGDISGAEEMFLEAIEVEPGNHHYSSNYAWFLWKTGALDTCYPLDPSLPPPEP